MGMENIDSEIIKKLERKIIELDNRLSELENKSE